MSGRNHTVRRLVVTLVAESKMYGTDMSDFSHLRDEEWVCIAIVVEILYTAKLLIASVENGPLDHLTTLDHYIREHVTVTIASRLEALLRVCCCT